MNTTSPGLPLVKEKKLNLQKCVICQNAKDKRGDKKLTSTEKGRQTFMECSKALQDNLFGELNLNELNDINYLVNTCYPSYVKLRKRAENKDIKHQACNDDHAEEGIARDQRAKRRKIEFTSVKEKPCIICDKMKHKGDNNKIRVCERRSAQKLLSATRFFKDDVHTRCVLLESPGDVFAADIPYHKNCMSSYILKFKRELEWVMMDDEDNVDDSVEALFNDVLQTLNLRQEAHYISTARDLLNDRLKEGNLGM